MVKSIEALRRKLRAPLPAEAITQNADNERSAVNPMFIVERLNDCFGEDGWEINYRVQESHPNSKMIVVECLLNCWLPWVKDRPEKAHIRRRAFGGQSNDDRGDAFKGACTDALTKAASHLGIAHQVYKGLYDLQPRAVAVEPETPKRDGRVLNQGQVQNFWAAVKESGKSQAEVDEFLASLKIEAVGDMLKTSYESSMDWAKQKAQAA